MKSLRFLSLLAVALVLSPTLFATDFGVRGGTYNDIGEEFVGAELVFDVGSVNVNPNLEYALADDVEMGSANVDVTFDIGDFGRFTPYVGAGLGLFYVDNDFGNSTDLVGNLIGGVEFDLQFLKPYAQIKYFRILEDADDETGDDLAFTIGLRF